MIKGSFVLVARNDYYCGNSVSRLTNTLNFLGEALSETKNLDQSECVLVDWASPDKPLKEVLVLNDEIKKILKIITVDKKIALKYQKNSPFSEVHAMNCGFRHISGKHFMRIDQDTLVGYRFIDWFFNEYEVKNYGFEWPKVCFSGRRNLNLKQSFGYKSIIKDEKLSKEIDILHPLCYQNRIYPIPRIHSFYGCAVGIMMVEKNLYEQEKGFNEELIYMNQMDVEFLNRLCEQGNSIYNLSQKTEADFYHQHHPKVKGSYAPDRKSNSQAYRNNIFENNNPKNWGLKEENLEIFKY
jgi:hypothetical protein